MTSRPVAMTDDLIDQQTLDDLRTGRWPVREEIEPQSAQRLWDNVDGGWTGPLATAAVSIYIRKVVYKCTGCHEASQHPGQVSDHITSVRLTGERHRRARIKVELRGQEPVQMCSACGAMFSPRKNAGYKHLENIKILAPAHKEAREERILRFSLGPPSAKAEVVPA